MDDLISRAEAIDAVQHAFDRETLLNSFVRKVAVDALKTMPSAQQWIPISERMPPIGIEVLATCGGIVTTAGYIGNGTWFTCEGNSSAATADIDAWMPKPKPYNWWGRLNEAGRRQCYKEYCYLMELEWDSSKCLPYEEWCAESEEIGMPFGLEYDL